MDVLEFNKMITVEPQHAGLIQSEGKAENLYCEMTFERFPVVRST